MPDYEMDQFGPRPPAAAPPPSSTGEVPTYSADDYESVAFGPRPPPPAPPPPDTLAGRVKTFTGEAIDALPVIGRPLHNALDMSVAGVTSFQTGEPFSSVLDRLVSSREPYAKANPNTANLGKGTGQALGYGALASKFPELFGIASGAAPASIPVRAATSASFNALISSADAASRGESPATAGLVGGTAGLLGPAVGSGIASLTKSYVVPSIAKLATLATEKYGIPLSADLLSRNPMVRFAGSVAGKLPGTGGTAAYYTRRDAFSKALAGTVGENAPSLTDDVFKAAEKRTGDMFESFGSMVPEMRINDAFGNKMVGIINRAYSTLDVGMRPAFRRLVDHIATSFDEGGNMVTGSRWRAMTATGSELDAALKSKNGDYATFAGEIKSALTDLLQENASPEAAATIAKARLRWRTLETLKPLVKKYPDGDIPPSAVAAQYAKNGGERDLGELSLIGQKLLKDQPSSGTSERALVMHVLHFMEVAGTAGAAAYHTAFDPKAMIAGVLAPAAIGRGLGALSREPHLVNALIKGASRTGPGTAEYVVPGAVQALAKPVTPLLPTPPLLLPPPSPTAPSQ